MDPMQYVSGLYDLLGQLPGLMGNMQGMYQPINLGNSYQVDPFGGVGAAQSAFAGLPNMNQSYTGIGSLPGSSNSNWSGSLAGLLDSATSYLNPYQGTTPTTPFDPEMIDMMSPASQGSGGFNFNFAPQMTNTAMGGSANAYAYGGAGGGGSQPQTNPSNPSTPGPTQPYSPYQQPPYSPYSPGGPYQQPPYSPYSPGGGGSPYQLPPYNPYSPGGGLGGGSFPGMGTYPGTDPNFLPGFQPPTGMGGGASMGGDFGSPYAIDPYQTWLNSSANPNRVVPDVLSTPGTPEWAAQHGTPQVGSPSDYYYQGGTGMGTYMPNNYQMQGQQNPQSLYNQLLSPQMSRGPSYAPQTQRGPSYGPQNMPPGSLSGALSQRDGMTSVSPYGWNFGTMQPGGLPPMPPQQQDFPGTPYQGFDTYQAGNGVGYQPSLGTYMSGFTNNYDYGQPQYNPPRQQQGGQNFYGTGLNNFNQQPPPENNSWAGWTPPRPTYGTPPSVPPGQPGWQPPPGFQGGQQRRPQQGYQQPQGGYQPQQGYQPQSGPQGIWGRPQQPQGGYQPQQQPQNGPSGVYQGGQQGGYQPQQQGYQPQQSGPSGIWNRGQQGGVHPPTGWQGMQRRPQQGNAPTPQTSSGQSSGMGQTMPYGSPWGMFTPQQEGQSAQQVEGPKNGQNFAPQTEGQSQQQKMPAPNQPAPGSNPRSGGWGQWRPRFGRGGTSQGGFSVSGSATQ